MNIGMLWVDSDPKTDLVTKINEAAAYYQKKYGARPDTCFIHPTMFSAGCELPGIEIKTNRAVRPNHFWIGVNTDANTDSKCIPPL